MGQIVGFGPFEWDSDACELRRKGIKVRLPRQPAEILRQLLAAPGEIVSRDDLRRRLWGEDTFVDFEQGLNTAVARLRQALGDAAEAPRYVETVPARGYRFVGTIREEGAEHRARTRPYAAIDRRTWLAGGLGAVGGVVGAYLFGVGGGRSDSNPGRFVLSTPPAPPLQLNPMFESVAIAPDGDRIAYACRRDGRASLYQRPIRETEGRFLPGSEVHNPFFSPDGREIGYYRFPDQALLRVSSLGGEPSVIATGVGLVAGASWSPREEIVFGARLANAGLVRIPVAGGDPEPLTHPASGERHVMPEILPGGRAALFVILPADSSSAPPQVAVANLDTGSYRALIPGSRPRYAPTGHLVFVVEDRLMAVRFDPSRLAVAGAPATVLEGIATSARGLGHYAFSRTGALVVAVGAATGARDLVWVSRSGAEEPIDLPSRGFTYPRISPDGRRVALDARDARGSDILVWNPARQGLRRLTPASNISIYPTWSPDGEQLAFWSDLPRPGLYRKPVDGSSPAEVWSPADELRALYFFTPSGRELVFARQGPNGVQLCRVEMGGTEPAVLLANARNAELAPYGRRMAYQSDADGELQVYVRTFPSVEAGYYQISTRGGVQPVWSPSGTELYYVEPGPSARLMMVRMGSQPASLPGRPEAILEWPYLTGVLGRTYDISRPEGDRFLAVKPGTPEGEARPRVEIVFDWFAELARIG